MHTVYMTALLLLIAGCKPVVKDKKGQAPPARLVQTAAIDYTRCKAAAATIRGQQKDRWTSLSLTQKAALFTRTVTEKIIPAWLGTAWHFYGTTETPGKGAIACGYFVTTVLRDAGLPIARAKLAQCASEQMITALIQSACIKRYSNTSFSSFIASIDKQGYGLYIIGLDNHTGFLYHDGRELYFIHASYIGAAVVTKEPAATALLLQQSRYRVTGRMSSDERLLNRWAMWY